MKHYLRVLIACVALFGNAAPSFANFSMSPSGTTTAFAIDAANQGTSLCAAASTECPAAVLINTAGVPLFTSGVPGLVTLTGTNNINNIAGTISLPTGAATSANQATEISSLATIATNTGAAIPAGTANIGNVGTISQYPNGSVPIDATNTGTTGATTATLTADASNFLFICGYSIRANAAAAATGNATVTGLTTSPLNFTQWTAPSASGLGVNEQVFIPCRPTSAVNTAITVVSAAPGTSGIVSVTAWGYKKTTSP